MAHQFGQNGKCRATHILHETAPGILEAHRQPEQLVIGRVNRGGGLAGLCFVGIGPRGGTAKGPGGNCLADQCAHLSDVFAGCRFAPRTAVAHGEHPQRRMGHLRGNIDVELALVERVEIFRERLPIPGQAFHQYRLGDVFHHLDQRAAIFRAAGGKADTASAHQHRGDPVPRGGLHAVVPARLTVVMGVNIDEAGRDQLAAGIDLFRTAPLYGPDRDNFTATNGNIADEGLRAGPIDDGATPNHQIIGLGVHHVSSRQIRSVRRLA